MARGSSLLPFALVALLTSVAACGSSPAPVDAIQFDPCQPLALAPEADVTLEQAAALRAAIAMWNDGAHSRLALTLTGPPSSAATLPVRFQAAASLSHGFYDGQTGTVFVNTDLQGLALSITIAHEVGHAFGLVHVSQQQRLSVMNPGNLDTTPTGEDLRALAELWGSCPMAE